MVGYSKKSLAEKLGIYAGEEIAAFYAPDSYKKELAFLDLIWVDHLRSHDYNFIHSFYSERKSLEKFFPQMKKKLNPNGMLWISWPKSSSGVKTDLNENIVREIGLNNGLVDVKVAAIDEVWSGLKFVFRLKDR